MIGKIILHYKILEKLGQGGMGVVYLAEDTRLDRKVAIKFLPRHIAGNSDECKRFEIKTKAAVALSQSNTSRNYTIEESDDQQFITMEYIEGRELKNLITDQHDLPGEEGGHGVPKPENIKEVLSRLDKYLGPVEK